MTTQTTAMITHTYLHSIAAAKAAIKAKSTTHVYMNPRMGHLDLWMQVTKKQALDFLGMIGKDADPMDCGMGGDAFGSVTNFGEVYIG